MSLPINHNREYMRLVTSELAALRALNAAPNVSPRLAKLADKAANSRGEDAERAKRGKFVIFRPMGAF